MVHKSHKRLEVDYIIHIDEVKPWPPSQSLSTIRSVQIQWEHGARASGFTNHALPSVSRGSIEFNDSFRLRNGNACIQFNLYEPRRHKGGQLLGTAVLDLATCGVIKESVSISTPINCNRTYRNSPQPLLFLKIQPVMNRHHGESDDDDVSSRSSLAADSNGSSSPLSNKKGIKENVLTQLSSEGTILTSSSSKELRGEMNHKINRHSSSGFRKKVSSTGAEIHENYVEEEGAEVDNSVESGKSNNRSARKEANASRKESLEQRIQLLEGELREAAALEVSLYSVSAEHGSSTNKVHAPARRLLRLYFNADKKNPKLGRASASKSIVSGLILVAKACGNDVPRLTFWLSNTTTLRAIISKSFGDGQLPNCKAIEKNGKKKPSPFKVTRGVNGDEREKPLGFVAALEKVEAWIFSRIIEYLWWQTFTPHMQPQAIRTSISKSCRRTSSSIEQQQQNFSLELWKKAFKDACDRICPVRGGGHDCGCLHLLSKGIMKQLVARLDVAMFNAILRESADEIPTDPIADPINDADVLPIPAGKASFGAGVQLKNAIGNWSRWLTDLFGMDGDDVLETVDGRAFCQLNALSDLMMLPKDLLLRKEACPTFGLPLLGRVLKSFTPDEFCPDPVPGAVLEALNSDSQEDSRVNLPSVVYQSPSADSVAASIIGSGLLKKAQTSDDELDQLDSPPKAIISLSNDKYNRRASGRVRYQLLRQVWKE